MTVCDLAEKTCKPCEGGVEPLDRSRAEDLARQLHQDWQIADDVKSLTRTYTFKNYYQTMAFVNALAWIAHQEDHHPDLKVTYKNCEVTYSTHAIGGLSENDFICAAKVDCLVAPPGD